MGHRCLEATFAVEERGNLSPAANPKTPTEDNISVT